MLLIFRPSLRTFFIIFSASPPGSTIIDFTENPPKVIRKGDGNYKYGNI